MPGGGGDIFLKTAFVRRRTWRTLLRAISGEGSGQPGLERALVQILVRVANIHVRNLKPDARSRVPGEAYCARGDATLSGVRELLERDFF